MTLFLTESELYQLTDCQKRSKQVEWLNKYGWKYAESRLGRVKVLRSYAEMRMGMPVKGEQEQTTEPDFSRI
ncbi:DUF4224 domain-containing protein [Nitrosomonas oligotropha]|uniref:DUF4224 domain-containing protein n=1 Tax=Nitrosomonas oligotropha TaxID=42354 RepID=UPI00136A4A36|nr:DUF4224 domain-containing protein [Nitrosomonas oligotropha]MXS82780.1 DUF4224 domain-containing protein [Nitrosomonas oligotropha]